jgi:phosphoglycerate dehydrogenase-like enzyme
LSEEARRTRIVSGIALTDVERRALRARGAELILDSGAGDEPAAIKAVSEADVWVGPGLTTPVLLAASRLRWFQTLTAGVEYFMTPELIASSVVVSNVRSSYSAPADHALAVMLSLSRALPRMARQQASHDWQSPVASEIIPMNGRRLLTIGTGHIGSAVAARAAAFGMIVDGVSRSGSAKAGFVTVYPTNRLVAAVTSADWIVNACPLTPETLGIVSEDVLSNTRPGVAFVNVGRAKTVDNAALLAMIKSGHIRAAGLDVFEQEPLADHDELWDLPNVLLTPHSAGVAPDVDSRDSSFACFLSNLDRYQQDLPLLTTINKRLGY